METGFKAILSASFLLAGVASSESSATPSGAARGWEVSLDCPPSFKKGSTYSGAINFGGQEAALTQKYEITVKLYEKDLGRDDLITSKVLIFESKRDDFAPAPIKGTVPFSFSPADKEIGKDLELYVIIEAKNVSSNPIWKIQDYRGPVKVIRREK